MRILCTNTSGIGDFVLREPLYRAMSDAGHEVTLTIGTNAAKFARWIAPRASICTLPKHPFAKDFEASREQIGAVLDRIQDLDPELLLIPYYFWTVFEEAVSMAFPKIPLMRSSGMCIPNGRQTLPPEARPETVVPVPAGIPEMKKIELVGSTLLQAPVRWQAPTLTPHEEDLETARKKLRKFGLAEGAYLVACAGASIDRFRGWQQDRWAEVLSWATKHYGLPIVFLGGYREHETTEIVRAAMDGHVTYSVCADEDHMGTIAGLIALSSGYFGRDTGPMHVAAALNKPVFAVFSGNYWPRFIPVTRAGIAITAKVHCAGCILRCPFPEPYCINLVSAQAVIEAARTVDLNDTGGLKVFTVDPANVASPETLQILDDHRTQHPRMSWEKYLWPAISREAGKDPYFRERLLQDPARALAEWGVELPAGRSVKILADSPEKLHRVLPREYA